MKNQKLKMDNKINVNVLNTTVIIKVKNQKLKRWTTK